MAIVVKNLPANTGDTRDAGSIPGLGKPLEESMAIHSSIPAWRNPWIEERSLEHFGQCYAVNHCRIPTMGIVGDHRDVQVSVAFYRFVNFH